MSFLPIHLSPSGAEIYYSGAYAHATGATGAGGIYGTVASAQGWNTVTFRNAAVRVGIGSVLPTGDSITTSVNYSLAPAVVIGGATPIGDVRGDGTGYTPQGTSSTVSPLDQNKLYSGALYAVYGVGSTEKLTGKVGVGLTTPWDYYEGSFTTRDNYNFDTILTVDTGNLNETGLGSGVYTIGESVTLQTTLNDRLGNALNTVSSITQDSFVKGVNVSILNEDRSVLYSGYKTDYQNPSFTFTKQENIDLFGSFTENFGVRFDVQNQDGGTHSTDFLLYGNRLSINKIYVSASGGTYLDENPDNDSGPSTDDITAAGDKLEAVVGFSHRLINTSGTTGAINFNLTFDQSPSFTNYDNLLVFANTGVSSAFDTTTDNLLGTFPLSQLKNQNIRVFPDDGVVEGEANFFKFVASSKIGFYNELFTVGPYTIQPVELGTDPILYNVGEQEIVSGNLSILGDGAGGLYALGASGTGDGQRITGPGRLPYLLSGDSPAETQNLQQVTDIGNTTTNSIISSGPYVSGESGLFNYLGIGTTIPFDPFGGIEVKRKNSPTTAPPFSVSTTYGNVGIGVTAGTPEAGDPYVFRVKAKQIGLENDTKIIVGSGATKGIGIGTSVVPTGNSFEVVGIGTTVPSFTVGSGSGTAGVGIGTTYAPADKTFEVVGLGTTSSSIVVGIGSTATATVGIGTSAAPTGKNTFEVVGIGTTAPSLVVGTGSGTANVGIGTTEAPTSNTFEVVGIGSTNPSIAVKAGIGTTAGYVGIGSSNPSFPLDASTIEKANIAAANSYIYSTGSAIFGGANHIITGDFDVIAGGAKANISGGNFNFIGGGSGINVDHSTYSSSIGGFDNDVFSGSYSVIGGGRSNLISGKASESHSDNSAILGGQQNKVISAPYSFIGGGNSNLITGTSAIYSAILGGNSSHITNSQYGVILAGDNNKINYANTALAAGNYSIVQSGHHGAFVLSDSRTAEYQSTGGNTLNLRFQSGVFVDTDSGIYINGNPVMTGASDEDTDTLQTVTDRGNTTTTSINSTGPHISGGTGIFMEKLSVGTPYSSYNATIKGTLQIKDVGATYDGLLFTSNVGGEGRIVATNTDHGTTHPLWLGGEYIKFTVRTGAEVEAMRLVQGSDGSGRLGINTDDPDYHLDIHTSSNDQGIRLYAAQSTRTAAELLIDSATNGNAEFRMYHGTVLNTRIRSNVAEPTYFNAGNVGIGTNAPLTKLDVRGDISGSGSFLGTGAGNRITNNNVPYLLSGDAAAALTLQDVTDNGNTTTNSVYIHGSGDGANYASLNVSGNGTLAFLRATGTTAYLQFQNSTTTHGLSSREGLTIGNNGNDAYIMQREAAPLYLGTSGEARMTIAADGKVGIGTLSPAELLHVDEGYILADGASTNHGFELRRDASDTFQIRHLGGNFTINNLTDTRKDVSIDGDGNVGIGTDVPSATLDVDGGIKLLDNNYLTWRGSNTRMVANSDYFQFQVAASDTMRLTSAGNVGIGTITPNAKLDVRGDISGSGNFYGTGVGSRITNNGTPYLLSGDAAAALTLQDVTDNGATTTNAIIANNAGGTGITTRGLAISNGMYAVTKLLTDGSISGASAVIDGNVGIGKTDPAYDLDVAGTIRVTGGNILIQKNDPYIGFQDNSGGTYDALWQYANNDMKFIWGGGIKFKIDSAGGITLGQDYSTNHSAPSKGLIMEGRLGIGVTTPDNPIEVSGSDNGIKIYAKSTDRPRLTFDCGGTDKLILSSNSTYGAIGDGTDTNRYMAFYNGNVGINITDPDEKLEIDGNIKIGADKWYRMGGDVFQIGLDGGNVGMHFHAGSAERMTILYSGNVGIGTTNPLTRLVVDTPMYQGGTNPSGMIVTDSAYGAMALELGVDRTNNASYIESRHTGSNTAYTLLLNAGYGKVGVGTVSPTSKFEVGTVAYGTNSIAKFWDGTHGVEITNRGANRQQINFLGSNTSAINASGSLFINYDCDNNGSNDTITFARNGIDEAGTVDMVITEGNVGIGTASPADTLQVAGQVRIDGSTTDGLTVTSNAGASRGLEIYNNSSTDTASIINYYNGPLLLGQHNTTVITIDNDSVGINVTAPAGDKLMVQAENNYFAARLDGATTAGQSNGLRVRAGYNSTDRPVLIEKADGTDIFIIDGLGNVGIGTAPSNALDVVGHFSATSKSFLIDHPTKENKKLQYASLEGPENGVYVRGTTNSTIIELPDYWSELVHEDSITVVLTPIGKKQDLYIKSKTPENVMIGGVEGSYDYVVYGERKDVAKLEIEPLKV